MNRAEVEVLLKTIYSGEGAAKAVADLDKISASGKKVAGSLRMTQKAAAEVFAGVSASTRARNPKLFGIPGGAAGGAASPGAVPPVIPPLVIPNAPSAGGSSGGGGGAAGSGILQRFISRLFSRALSISAGILVYRAINAPLQALAKTIKGLNDAIETARRLYASALTSGLGLQFTTKRNLLASVIGVSEKDVLKFGQAISFVAPRLKSATDILSTTAPSLTSVSYGFKILQADLTAMFALIASDFAPEIRKTTAFFSALIHEFERFHKAFANVFKFITNALIDQLPDYLRILIKAIQAAPDPGNAPDPISNMQQIHASALEHMGLIIGGIGGASDFAAQTAQNTKATAVAVQKIAIKMTGGGSTGPFGDSLLNSRP